MNILIVEDSKSICGILRRVIHSVVPDAKVQMAVGQEEADQALAKPDMQLVLLKINSQTVDWEGLLQEMNRKHPTVPVLMLFASGDDETLPRATAQGASGWLRKPFASCQLREKLRALGLM